LPEICILSENLKATEWLNNNSPGYTPGLESVNFPCKNLYTLNLCHIFDLLVKLFGLSNLLNLTINIMTKDDKLTEEKIFDAATEVFEEKGLAATRMQDIADRAGINKALLH